MNTWQMIGYIISFVCGSTAAMFVYMVIVVHTEVQDSVFNKFSSFLDRRSQTFVNVLLTSVLVFDAICFFASFGLLVSGRDRFFEFVLESGFVTLVILMVRFGFICATRLMFPKRNKGRQ